MKRPSHLQQVQRLSEQVGNFISYWGFKKIHGIIWTHVYLSANPISAKELIQRIRISKALVSLSIKDLIKYNLIIQTEDSRNKKNKFYSANQNVFEAIRMVLETRERVMLSKTRKELNSLKALSNEETSTSLSLERLNSLDEMVSGAEAALENLILLSAMNPDFLNPMKE
jgi:DNA-binding transcriptional regulator GbsR (MarR family)